MKLSEEIALLEQQSEQVEALEAKQQELQHALDCTMQQLRDASQARTRLNHIQDLITNNTLEFIPGREPMDVTIHDEVRFLPDPPKGGVLTVLNDNGQPLHVIPIQEVQITEAVATATGKPTQITLQEPPNLTLTGLVEFVLREHPTEWFTARMVTETLNKWGKKPNPSSVSALLYAGHKAGKFQHKNVPISTQPKPASYYSLQGGAEIPPPPGTTQKPPTPKPAPSGPDRLPPESLQLNRKQKTILRVLCRRPNGETEHFVYSSVKAEIPDTQRYEVQDALRLLVQHGYLVAVTGETPLTRYKPTEHAFISVA